MYFFIKDLELREEEVFRLRKIRDEVGSEIEDLTASLFEVIFLVFKYVLVTVIEKLGLLQNALSKLKNITFLVNTN